MSRNLNNRLYVILFFFLALLIFSGCATKTGYLRDHPYLDREERDAFLRGDVRPGFDQEMVRLAWGSPSNTSSNVTKLSDEEVWLYPKSLWLPLFGTVKSEYRYVYFEGGKVVRVRTVRGREKYEEKMEKAETLSAH